MDYSMPGPPVLRHLSACSNSCPLSQWCHPTITSSVVPFSSRHHITSDSQSIRVSASASVLPMNIQDWSPLGWTGWISLLSKGLSGVFSNTTVPKNQFCSIQCFLCHVHPHMTTWKTIALTIPTFVGKVMSLLINILSRFVISFLPRSKGLYLHNCSHSLQWVWSSRKNVCHCFNCFPINLPWSKADHRTLLIAQSVKNPPAMQATPVQFLGGKHPLEKG